MDPLDLHDVDPQRRSGVALDHIHRAKTEHQREHRRSRALTAREALLALQFEALFVYVCASNLKNGVILDEADMERLAIAVSRIDVLTQEAL